MSSSSSCLPPGIVHCRLNPSHTMRVRMHKLSQLTSKSAAWAWNKKFRSEFSVLQRSKQVNIEWVIAFSPKLAQHNPVAIRFQMPLQPGDCFQSNRRARSRRHVFVFVKVFRRRFCIIIDMRSRVWPQTAKLRSTAARRRKIWGLKHGAAQACFGTG